jgi:hypothetical protein
VAEVFSTDVLPPFIEKIPIIPQQPPLWNELPTFGVGITNLVTVHLPLLRRPPRLSN